MAPLSSEYQDDDNLRKEGSPSSVPAPRGACRGSGAECGAWRGVSLGSMCFLCDHQGEGISQFKGKALS